MNDLIRKVLQGDREAFREIVVEYGPGIRAFFAVYINDSSTVDDLAQETFISAYESLAIFKPDGNFGAWLRGIARNKFKMFMRRTATERNTLEEYRRRTLQEVSSRFPDILGDTHTAAVRKLQECLKRLPQRLKDVIQKRYFDRKRVDSIAEIMGTTRTAISSLLFRGRKQLEACIQRSE